MTESEIYVLNLIRNSDDPEKAEQEAIRILSSFLKQLAKDR